MTLIAMLVWLALLHVAPGAENQFPFPYAHGLGLAIPEGVEVSMELPARAKIGDSIEGRFIVRNTGTKPFDISTGGDYRSQGVPQRLRVRITDSTGNVLPDMTKGMMFFGGILQRKKIEPGKSHEVAFPLQAYATFTDQGTYTVEAAHDLGWKVDDAHPHPVAKTKIEIALPSPEEAAGRVRELCADADADTNRARERQISKLEHPIFLPSLIAEAEAGRAIATTGISRIATKEATEALVKLLGHSSEEVVKGSVRGLMPRVPVLEGTSRAEVFLPRGSEKTNAFLKTWEPKFRAQLMDAAHRLLKSDDDTAVASGASVIWRQGGEDDAQALLTAIQRALDRPWTPRAGKGANVLNAPGPLDSLVHALDSLRARGWRTDGHGRTAVILAYFRQIADPKMPRPDDDHWKQSIIAFMGQNPPAFRENAVRAIPIPVPDEFVNPLLKALDDQDWGVIRTACEVAGKSGRKVFIPALAHVVETVHDRWVQRSAHDAVIALGGRTELWAAWCEAITDQDCMHEAVASLISGTIELPESKGAGGNSNFTREQRFAIRDAWRAFLAKHHDTLADGRCVPKDDSSVTPILTGSNFNPDNPVAALHLKDGTSWPLRAPKSH